MNPRKEKMTLMIDGKPIVMTTYFKLKLNDKCPQCNAISEREETKRGMKWKCPKCEFEFFI